jgi:hypothetical protein|tara:strand:+ start:482 stop:724 length:243 start_codon:yes stop_codon:yes gene_type:complete
LVQSALPGRLQSFLRLIGNHFRLYQALLEQVYQYVTNTAKSAPHVPLRCLVDMGASPTQSITTFIARFISLLPAMKSAQV